VAIRRDRLHRPLPVVPEHPHSQSSDPSSQDKQEARTIQHRQSFFPGSFQRWRPRIHTIDGKGRSREAGSGKEGSGYGTRTVATPFARKGEGVGTLETTIGRGVERDTRCMGKTCTLRSEKKAIAVKESIDHRLRRGASPSLSCKRLNPPVSALIRRGPVRSCPVDWTVSTISYTTRLMCEL